MVRAFPMAIATASLLIVMPVMGFANDSGSSSRADTRLKQDTQAAQTVEASGSKGRRGTRVATKSYDKEEVEVVQTKRSRRNPSGGGAEDTQVATVEPQASPLVVLAESETAALAAHIERGDFSGNIGALALFQLVGKAAGEMPMTQVEIAALTTLAEEQDLSDVFRDAEARLVKAAAGRATLDEIAEALGVPRPVLDGVSLPKLGATLKTDAAQNAG